MGKGAPGFVLGWKSLLAKVRVPRGITKTLEAAYLLKTGGKERVEKASQPSVCFLVDGPDSPKPPELRFLPTATNLPALIHLKPDITPDGRDHPGL